MSKDIIYNYEPYGLIGILLFLLGIVYISIYDTSSFVRGLILFVLVL